MNTSGDGRRSEHGGVFWACTLSLLEVLRFGYRAWWWRLRWAARREYQDLDIAELVTRHRQRSGAEFSYGETPSVTLARLLELADLAPGSRFVDLGSGRGLAVVCAGLMGYRGAGLEAIGEFVERSRRLAARLRLDVEFQQADMLGDPWPLGELYLINSTAFPEAFRIRLVERLEELEPGCLVATFDWELPSGAFEPLKALRLPVTRGTVMARLFRRSAHKGL